MGLPDESGAAASSHASELYSQVPCALGSSLLVGPRAFPPGASHCNRVQTLTSCDGEGVGRSSPSFVFSHRPGAGNPESGFLGMFCFHTVWRVFVSPQSTDTPARRRLDKKHATCLGPASGLEKQ